MNFWHWVTRLGEAQILLPLVLALAAARGWHADGRAAVLRWMAIQGLAVALVVATKLAFMGWGMGWPALNFTGISGHAMFAASACPLLAQAMASGMRPRFRSGAVIAGGMLAILVGVSRVVVGAHSPSEVAAGWVVGFWVSAAGLSDAGRDRPMGLMAPLATAAWLALMPVHAPPSQTHSLMTRIALAISGHDKPHTRAEMLREFRVERQARRERPPAPRLTSP